jgi:hypothetical protein
MFGYVLKLKKLLDFKLKKNYLKTMQKFYFLYLKIFKFKINFLDAKHSQLANLFLIFKINKLILNYIFILHPGTKNNSTKQKF